MEEEEEELTTTTTTSKTFLFLHILWPRFIITIDHNIFSCFFLLSKP